MAIDYNFSAKAVIPLIKELVEDNEHTEAYILGATAVGDIDMKAMLRGIKSAVEILGYLDEDYNRDRRRCYENMLKTAQARLSPEVYEEFKGAF